MDEPLTLPLILERTERLFADVPVVERRPDGAVHRADWGTVCRRVRRLADALRRAGLAPGARVATLMWNHRAHLEVYFAAPAAGLVVHTLNPRLHPDELAYIATHADDHLLVVDEGLLEVLAAFRARAPFRRVLVVRHGATGALPAGCEDYEAFLAAGAADAPFAAVDERAPAGMCYTSGTTGRPKGVVYSHRAYVLHALMTSLPDSIGYSLRDTVMPVVPMFHVNAWGMPHAAALNGCALVLPGPRLDAESLLDLMETEGVTLAAGVPTVWLGVLRALDAAPGRRRLAEGLRLVVGGSAVPEAMIRGFDRHGVTVVHAWGMTEMTPIGSVFAPKRGFAGLDEEARYALRATQGLPAALVRMRLVDDGGRVLPWDGRGRGELQVRGPCVTGAYHGHPEDAESFTADGWFRTGDVATLSPEGYLRIVDRLKDLIKSGGEWIGSVDLENALMAHPAVAEAAVVAVPHPRWGERPLACVVPRAGARVTAAELRDFLARRFPKWWLPDDFVFLEAIPRTATGKFMKRALRARFRDRFRGAEGAP